MLLFLFSSAFALDATNDLKRRLAPAGMRRTEAVDVLAEYQGLSSTTSCYPTPATLTWTASVDDQGSVTPYMGTLVVAVPDGGKAKGISLLMVPGSSGDFSQAASWPAFKSKTSVWDAYKASSGCSADSSCDTAKQTSLEAARVFSLNEESYDFHSELSFWFNLNCDCPKWGNDGLCEWGEDSCYGTMDDEDLEVYYCYTPYSMYWQPDADLAGTVANIMGFLAQGSWETDRWQACDENNHTYKEDAGCTQRSDGEKYHSLTSGDFSCLVDANMEVTATMSQMNDPNPLQCKPGTDTEKCCWWGRGSIQTTGPSNVGALNYEIVQRSSTFGHIDLCKNPEQICLDEGLQFVSGLFFWVKSVETDACFGDSLAAYTKAFDAEAKPGTVDPTCVANDVEGADPRCEETDHLCRSFGRGVGGAVNNGNWWEMSHGEDCEDRKHHDDTVDCTTDPDGRLERFEALMEVAQEALTYYNEHKADTAVIQAAASCTGNEIVDFIFEKMDLSHLSKITTVHSILGSDETTSVYHWDGFCSALKEFIKE